MIPTRRGRMTKHYLTGLALACVLPLAVADDYTPAYGQCMDKASSTVAMSVHASRLKHRCRTSV